MTVLEARVQILEEQRQAQTQALRRLSLQAAKGRDPRLGQPPLVGAVGAATADYQYCPLCYMGSRGGDAHWSDCPDSTQQGPAPREEDGPNA